MVDEDRLVCAFCSGRVSEGRCPSCRSVLRGRQPALLPAAALLWLAAVVALLLLLLHL